MGHHVDWSGFCGRTTRRSSSLAYCTGGEYPRHSCGPLRAKRDGDPATAVAEVGVVAGAAAWRGDRCPPRFGVVLHQGGPSVAPVPPTTNWT